MGCSQTGKFCADVSNIIKLLLLMQNVACQESLAFGTACISFSYDF